MIYTRTIQNLETVASQFYYGEISINHAKMTSREGEELEWFEFFQDGQCTFSSPYWPDFVDEVLEGCTEALRAAREF